MENVHVNRSIFHSVIDFSIVLITSRPRHKGFSIGQSIGVVFPTFNTTHEYSCTRNQ